MATATVTTISAEQAANPGKVKVVYVGSGTVDVTMQTPTGVQQFSDVTDPTYEFWFARGELAASDRRRAGTMTPHYDFMPLVVPIAGALTVVRDDPTSPTKTAN